MLGSFRMFVRGALLIAALDVARAAESEDTAVDTGLYEAEPRTHAPSQWYAKTPGMPLSLLSAEVYGAQSLETWQQLAFEETRLPSKGEDFLRKRCVVVADDISRSVKHPLNGGSVPRDLEFALFDDLTATAQVRRQVTNVDGSFSWIGQVTSRSGGTVVMTVVGGESAAIIRDGSAVYMLQPDAACGGHALLEADTSAEALCPDGDGLEVDEGREVTDMSESSRVGAAPILSGPMSASNWANYTDPITDLPSLDIMVVYSPATETALGGYNGVVAYANNVVHEADLILLRSGARTHKPRLVHLTNPVNNPISDPGPTWVCSAPNPMFQSLGAITSDADIRNLRDVVGADWVIALLSRGYQYANNCSGGMVAGATTALGAIVDDPGLVLNPNRGYTAVAASGGATASWTFFHEILHTIDVRHKCAAGTGPCWQNGYTLGSASGYAQDITNPISNVTFRYTDVMASSGIPNPGGASPLTCKLPVLSRPAPFGWTPDPGTTLAPLDLCSQGIGLDKYASMGFDPSLVPLQTVGASRNGVQVGSTAGTHPIANTVGYLTSSWNNGKTPLEIVEDWKPAAASSLGGIVLTRASPGTLAHPTSSTPTLYWETSDYAAVVAPTPCYPPATTCDPDENPFYLTVGTTVGDDDVHAAWIGTDKFGFSQGGSTWYAEVVDISIDPTAMYFGRLWTQVSANDWRVTEFRINHGDRLVSCSDEDPLLSPAPTASCHGVTFSSDYSFDAAFGPPAVVVDLEDGAAGPSGWSSATATKYDIGMSHTPYNVALYGENDLGSPFCCLLNFADNADFGIELLGTDGDDLLFFEGAAAAAGTALKAAGVSLLAGAAGLSGNDVITGTTDGDVLFEGRGSWGTDLISIPPGGQGVMLGGPDADELIVMSDEAFVEGRNGPDVMVVATNLAGAGVELFGQNGADLLCTNSGGVAMIANDAPTSLADELYVSSTWSGTMGAHTANSSGASCGSTVHNALGPWAGSCSYSLTLPASACAIWGVSP